MVTKIKKDRNSNSINVLTSTYTGRHLAYHLDSRYMAHLLTNPHMVHPLADPHMVHPLACHHTAHSPTFYF